MIKEATFTSVWDGGIEITSNCKVNLETKEVFNIEKVDVDGLENLEREYITFDGEEHSVSNDKNGETEYWW